MLEGELDRFRVVVEALSNEYDPMEVAMAAVKLAHKASGADDEEAEEIVQPTPHEGRQGRFGDRGAGGKRPQRGGPRVASAGMSRLFIGAGRSAGVRPQDLVGAITGEAGITGREIGAIDITDRFALVEIADELVDGVIAALKTAKIKGKAVTVRRDRLN